MLLLLVDVHRAAEDEHGAVLLDGAGRRPVRSWTPRRDPVAAVDKRVGEDAWTHEWTVDDAQHLHGSHCTCAFCRQDEPFGPLTPSHATGTLEPMGVTLEDRCTVVLADDDDGFAASLAALLGTEPRIVVLGRASDGCEAVQMVQRLRPDVVLMDIQMPVTNGVEATAAIRARGIATWVIVVSGTRGAWIAEALAAGANAYVAKARVAEDLVTAILNAGLNTPV
jgi:CheY-like chemotaxis protein